MEAIINNTRLQAVLMVAMGLIASLFISGTTYAADLTWSGGGADDNISTVGNWVGGVAPTDGDVLIFPDMEYELVINDSLTTIGGITLEDYTGANLSSTVNLSGDFTLAGNISVGNKRTLLVDSTVVTVNTDLTIYLNDKVESRVNFMNGSLILGANNLTLEYPGHASKVASDGSNYISVVDFDGTVLTSSSGSEIIVNGVEMEFDAAADGTGLNSDITMTNGVLYFYNSNNLGNSTVTSNNSRVTVYDGSATGTKTITQDFIFNGNMYGADFTDGFLIGVEGLYLYGDYNADFTGSVTFVTGMAIDISNAISTQSTTFSGPLSGSGFPSVDAAYNEDYSLIVNSSSNTSAIPNGTYDMVTNTATLSDDQSSRGVIIASFSTATIDGIRDNVIINGGGTLEGTGTVGDVLAQSTATVSAGNSPGCLSTNSLTLSSGSILEIEIDSAGTTPCTDHDQLQVTGTVDITDSILQLSGSVPSGSSGETYIIIDNDGSDSVVGTFNGIAEGGTFEATLVGGSTVTFTVSYVGGDGNDVTLTYGESDDGGTIEDPDAPDTGFMILNTASPIVIAVSTLAASAALLVMGRRFATINNRR